jgi:hypothetical protein
MTFCDPRCWGRSAGFTNVAFAKRGRPLPRECKACDEGSAEGFPFGPWAPLEIVKLEQYSLP